MRKLRIHVEAEPGTAAIDGIDAKFLDKWLRAFIRAFASTSKDAPLKILSVSASSINAVASSDDDYMGSFADEIRKASKSSRAGAVPRQVREFLDLVPDDNDQIFEMLNEEDEVLERIPVRARSVAHRTRNLPQAEIRSFDARVEYVDVTPWRIALHDAERGQTLVTECTPEQSLEAIRLAKSEHGGLVATIASSSGRSEDRTHRLLDLAPRAEFETRRQHIADAQERFSAKEYISRHLNLFPTRMGK